MDVKAGHHDNTPSLRSSITKVVAKPAGSGIIGNMKNENISTQNLSTEDLEVNGGTTCPTLAYWLAVAMQHETDSADIGCEFDS